MAAITRLSVGSPIGRVLDFDLFDTKDLTGSSLEGASGMTEDEWWQRRRRLQALSGHGNRLPRAEVRRGIDGQINKKPPGAAAPKKR